MVLGVILTRHDLIIPLIRTIARIIRGIILEFFSSSPTFVSHPLNNQTAKDCLVQVEQVNPDADLPSDNYCPVRICQIHQEGLSDNPGRVQMVSGCAHVNFLPNDSGGILWRSRGTLP